MKSKYENENRKRKGLEAKLNNLQADIQKSNADITDLQNLKAETANLKSEYKELRWEEWGPWGQCTAQCKDGVGDRLQYRTRNKKTSSELRTSTQTESRPCASVQFAGCISPNNGHDFFAVAFDYLHMLAQSACTAMAPWGRVNAVRRTCSDDAPDCRAVCRAIGTTCFNALHVYHWTDWVTPLERSAAGQESLEIFKYDSCVSQHCGPNFCCCKSS